MQVKVVLPTITISLGNNVQNGQSITGTISLSSPSSLSGSLSVGLTSTSTSPRAVSVTSQVTVPGDGSTASFTVTGTAVSKNLNDVSIQASSGATSNTTQLTVWTVLGPFCQAIPMNTYSCNFSSGAASLTAPSNVCVVLGAGYVIVPTTAPYSWLSSLYPSTSVNMVQNDVSDNIVATWTLSYVEFNAGTVAGTHGHCYSSWSDTYSVPSQVSDALSQGAYPQPYGSYVNVTSDPWASSDGPETQEFDITTQAALLNDAGTAGIGWAYFKLTALSRKASFSDWCCINNNGTFIFPASTGWTINLSCNPFSFNEVNTDLNTQASTTGAQGSMVTSGEVANQYLADAVASETASSVYTATADNTESGS